MSKLICCRCKKEKEDNDFSFKNTKKNIRNKTCKECFKEVRKQWYINHKDSIIKKNLKNKEKNIEWFEEYKKNLKCTKCPETHIACLEFHHIDETEKEYNISQLAHSTYSINRILKEIKKCVVLCSNCHRKLHFEEKSSSFNG